jgi:hypothetical protein
VRSLLPDDEGFTLVEALVAMVLSTVVVMLVTSVFLVQNQFYSEAVKRAGLHESVRSATALISSDLHGVSEGGIVAAGPDRMVFRSPLLVGGVCGVDGRKTYLFLPADGESMDPSMVSGYAIKDAASAWRYTPAPWSSIYHSSGGTAAQSCARSGADTTGAVTGFFRLDGLDSSPSIKIGDLVMLYQEVELRLASSNLHPESRGVFRGAVGGVITEVATGLSSRSGFEYGLSDRGGFQDRVNGRGNLTRIERVRFFLEGIAPASRADRDSLTFDLTLTVPLRNGN